MARAATLRRTDETLVEAQRALRHGRYDEADVLLEAARCTLKNEGTTQSERRQAIDLCRQRHTALPPQPGDTAVLSALRRLVVEKQDEALHRAHQMIDERNDIRAYLEQILRVQAYLDVILMLDQWEGVE